MPLLLPFELLIDCFPFMLKMGVLGDFQFKFSILTQVLQKVYVDNLILFVQTKFHTESTNFRLSAEEQKVIPLLI